MLPELRISIDCDAAFRQPTQYTLATLALIAGRRVRFVSRGADLHYGPSSIPGAAWLPASSAAPTLLRRESAPTEVQDLEAFGRRFLSLFPVSTDTAPASDIVAATFFFLSLHEEWTTARRDQFGRFQSADSLLGKRGEVDRPVVAEYARVLAALLEQQQGAVSIEPRFAGRSAAAVMTHDIDYLSKFTPGLLFRELVKNFLFNRRHVSTADRARRLREYLAYARRRQDPYIVSITRMLEIEQRHGIIGSWLFKAGGSDKRDVTYSLESQRARDALALLREAGQDIGLHPSFHAHTDAAMLAREAARLRKAAGTELRSIRQHYLRFVYPLTWRQQSAEGFFADSTLGFAEQEGFRNGVCHPFLPWDLEAGEALSIWELPLTVMDGTLAHYRGLDPATSSARISRLLEVVAGQEGVAVLLFHNTSYDVHDFPGWGGVFERAAEEMSDGRFMTDSLHSVTLEWLRSGGYASTGEFLQVINSVPTE
ncbi:MAG: polysaccharide deacetylase family protein [Bacteroidetes bacterium]|nr:polysaccharide deacetylase family protein [Bacteroidota bacterium]